MAASSSHGGSSSTRPQRPNDWWDQPEDQFRREFRMGKPTFEMICANLEPELAQKRHTRPHDELSVHLQVALGLWRLATSVTFREISEKFGVAISACRKTVRAVIAAINKLLKPIYVGWPDPFMMNMNKQQFQAMSGIPNVGGALYTTHVPMFPPRTGANMYYNKLHTDRARLVTGSRDAFKFTTTIMGVVDHRGLFTEACVGCPGRLRDDEVLKSSGLYQTISRELRDVFMVGGSGYPLMDWLLVPYTDENLTPQQQTFNEKLGIIEDVAKKAFAKLKRRWGVLQQERRVEVEELNEEFHACIVLHNILEMRPEPMDPQWDYELFDDETVPENRVPSVSAIIARDQIAESLAA